MNANWVNRSQSARFGIYRNTKTGWIAGVCAGIADRLAIKPIWVRIAFIVLGTLFHAIPAILFYVICVLALAPRSVDFGYAAAPFPAGSPGYFADRFYSSANPIPMPGRYANSGNRAAYAPPPPPSGNRLQALAARFAALDARLNNIEAAVMSDELSLRRKFRDLGG